jgi:hypothetical protein
MKKFQKSSGISLKNYFLGMVANRIFREKMPMRFNGETCIAFQGF